MPAAVLSGLLTVAAMLALSVPMAMAETPQPTSVATLPLPEHTARYAVFRRGREIGYLDVELFDRSDGTWEYTVKSTPTTILLRILGVTAEEHGRFAWQQDMIRPLTYSQRVVRPGQNRFWEAEFDWDAMRATGSSHRGELDVVLSTGVLDPLTLRLQLALRLAAEHPPAPRYEFRVLERDEIEMQSYVLRGQENFEFDGGCLPTVFMERLREGDRRNDYSWHAEAFHWMPVRIQQIRDDLEELDLKLSRSSLPLRSVACL